MVGAFIIVVTLLKDAFSPRSLISLIFVLPLGIQSQIIVYSLLHEKREGWEEGRKFLSRWANWSLWWIYAIAAITLAIFINMGNYGPLGLLAIAAIVLIPSAYKQLAIRALAVLESEEIAEHYLRQKSG